MIALALGLALSLGAQAGERVLTTSPGPAARLIQCTGTGTARCWKRAKVLETFVSAQGEHRTVRLQIAQAETNMLVRVRGLSEDQSLEITVRRPGSRMVSDAQLIRAGNGVTVHALEKAVHTAPEIKAHIQLWDERSHTMHAWSPGARVRLTEAVTLWKAPPDQTSPSFGVQSNGTEWRITADADARISIGHRRPTLPSGGRGISPPWSLEPQPNEAFDAPPHAGDYEVRVRVGDALRSSIVSWTPNPSPAITNLGIHPPPKSTVRVADDAFALTASSTICAASPEQSEAAQWLAMELERLTALPIQSDCESARIQFEETEGLGAEGYAIQTRSDAIRIQSSTASGARYAAIAVADMLGLDGRAESADIRDEPSVARRVLFHEVSPHNGPMMRPEQTIAFIERVVARARFNTLILELKGGLKYRSHPKLSRKDAWTHADLSRVLDAAEKQGIEVIPALNSPAHSNWITAAYPELMEEGTHHLLCTRHPGTRALLKDLYAELHTAFRKPEFIHIGHDEIRWRTRWKHESQRCPRCANTPRWSLLADDLVWAHSALASLGSKPMLWSDMLVPGWHGAWDQMHRASRRIPESIRPDFHAISWGRTGDSVGTLTPLGYAVIRGNTGYADWKRPGLAAISRGVAGEALALFNAAPWSSFQGTSGPTRDYHHWTNVSLAGATAWNPAIETVPIDAAITALRDHPAYRPGMVHPPSSERRVMRIDDRIQHGDPKRIALSDSTVSRIALIQSAHYPLDTLGALAKANRSQQAAGGLVVGTATLEYIDGTHIALQPVRLGLHAEHPERAGRGSLLFGTARTMHTGESMAYAVEWTNPHPERKVRSVLLRAKQPGVEWRIEQLETEPTTTTSR